MKRTFLVPLAALTALASTAFAKAPDATPTAPELVPDEDRSDLARLQLKDALAKGLAIYNNGTDNFAFTLERAPDGSLLAQHWSHYSHRSHSSHSSHSSHRSHYSSRW